MKTYYNNKTALVTGGGSGIGRALCLRLAALGAKVCCADINLERAEETASLDDSKGVYPCLLDVTDKEAFDKTVEEVVEKYGALDFIFNNAGIAIGGEIRDLELEHWHKMMNTNFYGVLHGTMAAYRQMIKQATGHIVNVSSVAGLVPATVANAPYWVSKHAVVTFTRSLALEAAGLGVRVSLVCPGFVKTNIFDDSVSINVKESVDMGIEKMLKRAITADDAASHILQRAARGKELIVFPGYMKPFIFLSKILFFKTALKKFMKKFREKFRKNPEDVQD